MAKLTCPKCGRILDETEILREENRIGTSYLGCCKTSDGGCGSVIAFEVKYSRKKSRGVYHSRRL